MSVITGLTSNLKSKAMSRVIGEPQSRDRVVVAGADFTGTVKVKPQPRWGLRAAALAVIVLSILGNIWLYNHIRSTTSVLAVAVDVAQGERITASDVKAVTVNTDSGLSIVPADQKGSVVGQLAAKPLGAGDLLNAAMVTNAVVPARGQSMVGITVSTAKLPAEALRAGDFVRVVDTPREQDNAPVQGPITSRAQVVATRDLPQTGQVTVDVIVPEAEANWVAARAATGRVAVVLDSRQR